MRVAVVAHYGKTFGGGLPELRRVLEAEGIDDSEVRYRIGLRGTDGGTHWFVSEQVLFVEDEDDQETVERIGSVLEGLQEDRIRERLREAELIDD